MIMASEPTAAASAVVEPPPSPDDAVLQALQSARYNELVHLEVASDGDNDENVREICLAARLDEANGGVEWSPLTAPSEADAADDDDDHSPIDHKIQRHLRTKRWVLPMLNDRRRNDLYQLAVSRAVDRLMERAKWRGTPDPAQGDGSETKELAVLDIGSGSGLLSMMAARSVLDGNRRRTTTKAAAAPPRCGRIAVRPAVVAVEMSSAMARLSRSIVRDNRLEGHIRVVNAHSSQLELELELEREVSHEPHQRTGVGGSNPPLLVDRRADLCVSELLESGLLGEGLLPSMRDAWARLLAPDAVIVPASVRVYAAAVGPGGGGGGSSEDDDDGDKWIARYHPSTLCHQGDGVGWKALFDANDDDDRLSSAVVVPVHATKLLRDDHLKLLTEPACVLTIHFDKDRIPCERGQRHQLSIPVTQSGSVEGFLVWWELDLWKSDNPNEPSITYSMDPRNESSPFQDHWQQCLHVLPHPQNVLLGDAISLLASHDDSSVQLDLLPPDTKGESRRKRTRMDAPRQPVPFAFSHDRVFQLVQPVRSRFLRSAVAHAASLFSGKEASLHVLDVSDFGLCGLLAALHGGCGKVTCLESGGVPIAERTSRVAQASDLPKSCRFEILACHAEHLDRDVLGGSAPHVVVAEPYYQVLEGWHLQEALNYYYLIRSLRRRSALEPETIAVPSICRIMACGIESHQLRASYSPCGDGESSSVCGFDHSELNRHASVALHTLSLPLWQYDYQRVSGDVEIGRLDYMNPREGGIRSTTTLSFSRAGCLDAIMIWLEYGFGNDVSATESSAITLSTNARSYRQGVRMLKSPVEVTNCAQSTVVVRVDFAVGGMQGSEDHMMVVHVGESGDDRKQSPSQL